ncbi:N-acetyltransferase family protein [Nitratifractor sp.]
MTIRSAVIDDAESIARIHTLSWQDVYRAEMDPAYLTRVVPGERLELWTRRLVEPEREQRVLVAEEEGRLVGFACLYLNRHPRYGSYLDNLHVPSSHRGRGIGRWFLAETAGICLREAPGKGLYLLVTQKNLSAQAFYRSLGAIEAGETFWKAPDGGRILSCQYLWKDPGVLINPPQTSFWL